MASEEQRCNWQRLRHGASLSSKCHVTCTNIYTVFIAIAFIYATSALSTDEAAYRRNSHPIVSNRDSLLDTPKRHPSNFLRYRSTQEVTKVVTNDDHSDSSTPNNPGSSGTYISFNSITLNLDPVTIDISPVSSEAQYETHSKTISSNLKVLHNVIEEHINATFKEMSGLALDLFTLDYTKGRFDHAKLNEVQFVSYGSPTTKEGRLYDVDENEEEEEEPVRLRGRKRDLQYTTTITTSTTTSMNIQIPGGKAFYVFPTHSNPMASPDILPNSSELRQLVIQGIEKDQLDDSVSSSNPTINEYSTTGKVGGILASRLQNYDFTVFQAKSNIDPPIFVDNVGIDGTINDYLGMFDNIDSVTVVDTEDDDVTSTSTTPNPTTANPTPRPTNKPVTNSPISEQPTTPQPVTTYNLPTPQPTILGSFIGTPFPTFDNDIVPTTPSPITPSPVSPAPITSVPVSFAPVSPAPIEPSPITDSPVVSPAPQTSPPIQAPEPEPVAPDPLAPAPSNSPPPPSIGPETDYTDNTGSSTLFDKDDNNSEQTGEIVNTYNEGDDDYYNDGPTAFRPTGSELESVITAANSQSPNDNGGNEGNNKMIILASSIAAGVILIAIVAIFVYKRRKANSNSNGSEEEGDEVLMKGIPISSTIIVSDDFNTSGKGNGGGNMGRDLEGGRSTPRMEDNVQSQQRTIATASSQQQQRVETPQSDDDMLSSIFDRHGGQDEAYNKMIANAMAMGVASKGKKGDSNMKMSDQKQPLSIHDSLNLTKKKRSFDMSKQQPSSTQDISDHDIIAGARATKADLVYDDIDEAMQLATAHVNTVKSVDEVEKELAEIDTREQIRQQQPGIVQDGKVDAAGRPKSCPPSMLLNNNNNSRPTTPANNMRMMQRSRSRPSTPSMMTTNNQADTNSLTSHEILNDIKLLSERKRMLYGSTNEENLPHREEKEKKQERKSRSTPSPINFRCLTPSNLFSPGDVNELVVDDTPDKDFGGDDDVDSTLERKMLCISDDHMINDNEEEQMIKSHRPQMDPEEENYSHGILDAISSVAKSTRSLKKDTFVPVKSNSRPTTPSSSRPTTPKPPSVISPSAIPQRQQRSLDPPGVITVESNNVDDPSALHYAYAENSTFMGEGDETLATRAGCGSNILLGAKVIKKRSLECKQGGRNDRLPYVQQAPVTTDPSSHYISDDEESDDDNKVSKPWKDKWETPQFGAQPPSPLRFITPAMTVDTDTTLSKVETLDRVDKTSNYDPDSDWEVSDAEVEDYAAGGDDAFGTKKKAKSLRIW